MQLQKHREGCKLIIGVIIKIWRIPFLLCIKVPVRNFLFWQIRMINVKISCFLSCLQKPFIFSFSVHHGKTVNSPPLSLGPSRIISKALIRLTMQRFSISTIVDNVVGAKICIMQILFISTDSGLLPMTEKSNRRS